MKKLICLLLVVAVLAISAVAQASYSSGSCTGGSFTVTFSGANFVTGLGWSTGGSRTINFSGSCSGCSLGPIVYGWGSSPLVEYYIGRGGGSSAGSYSTSKGTFTLYTNSCNGPNITGDGPFTQYNASGSGGSGQPMGEHFSGWSSIGKGISSQNYMVVMVEGWSSNSGSASVSVSSSDWYTHWVGSGSASFTCGGGGSTTTTSASTTTTSASTTSTTTTSGGSTTTSGGGVDCSGLPTWSSSTIYSTAGTQVQYNSKAYSNKWYTQGQNPETNSGQWQVWTLLGTCGGGSTTTSASTTSTTTTSGTSTSTTTTSASTTTTSGGGTAPCSNPSSISTPFTRDGSGTYCYSLTSCSYINSWNLAELNVNGVNLTNKYVSSSQLPAKIDGKWIIKYVGNYSWSHFEAK